MSERPTTGPARAGSRGAVPASSSSPLLREDAALRFFESVPVFAEMEPAVLRAIASRSRPRLVRGGEPIFAEGDRCSDLYVLRDGRVKCFRTSIEGREQVFELFDRAGQVFCLTSAFSTGRHVTSARAIDRTTLYAVDIPSVAGLARTHASLALILLTIAGTHNASLIRLAEGLSLRSAAARLAAILRERAAVQGVRRGTGVELDRRSLREEELAAMVGTVRVHVSRSLRHLARAGAIHMNRRCIVIRDLAVLERLSEGA